MTRARLPERRASENVKFEWVKPSGSATKLHATLGFYDAEMTRLGEMFLNTTKTGTDLEVLFKDSAILMSLALQYGCPLDVIRRALLRKPSDVAEGPLGALFDLLLGPLPADPANGVTAP